MLIYVASYPRSGNSLMQAILTRRFKWPITGWELSDKLLPSDACTIRHKPDPGAMYFRVLDKLRWLAGVGPTLKRWLVTYDRAAALGAEPMPGLVTLGPGCGHGLNENNRRFLAELDTPIFVKTHELPLDTYLPGEYVLTMTRHPGPVLKSYFKLINRQSYSTPMEAVIRGQVRYGSWSHFQDRWAQAVDQLGDRAVALRFERMSADPVPGCAQISKMIGQPFSPEAQAADFSELKQRHPNYYSSGTAEANPQDYEPGQWALLLETHGQTMRRLGYLDADDADTP